MNLKEFATERKWKLKFLMLLIGLVVCTGSDLLVKGIVEKKLRNVPENVSGYAFEKQFLNFDPEDKIIENGMFNLYKDCELKLEFVPIEYTITYHIDIGNNNENNIITYNIETPEFTLFNPTETEYFSGWYDNESLYGQSITTIAGGKTGDIHLYGSWNPIKRVIILNSSDDTVELVAYEGYPFVLPEREKENLEFLGWYNEGIKIESGICNLKYEF